MRQRCIAPDRIAARRETADERRGVPQRLRRTTLNTAATGAARAIAARLIEAIIADGQSFARAAPALLATLGDERDRGFAQACVYGVLRHYDALSSELEPLLHRPLRTKDFDLRALLLSALFQLRHLDTPPHAAVSATVEGARALGKPWASGLVNAVLRGALRRGPVAPSAPPTYEHPAWLLARIQQDWPQEWANIVTANNAHPPLSLRVNLSRHSPADYLALLDAHGLPARPGRCAPTAVCLEQPVAVERLPGFADGLVSVQDEAAQLAVQLLAPAAGDAVLDACAAPGGKTGHVLETLAGSGRVVCVDHDTERSASIAANLERLGLHAEIIVGDAARPCDWWDHTAFDRILLDAPCSATGVIRRHPDIRFHRRASDIERLAATQSHLLRALWPLLREGGLLLYATCSILRVENDDVVANLLAGAPDAKIDVIEHGWGRATRYGRQILPGDEDMDGFYYALLRKGATL
ncbi:MAG: 16S rRNA (cytosine(967)-C(5))-methyltransferase RsmB [Gammaproteobacteria bacterium]